MRYLIAPPGVSTFPTDSAPTDPVVRLMVPGLGHLDICAITMLIDTNHFSCTLFLTVMPNSFNNSFNASISACCWRRVVAISCACSHIRPLSNWINKSAISFAVIFCSLGCISLAWHCVVRCSQIGHATLPPSRGAVAGSFEF